MAHGFGGTMQMWLAQYAERFCAAGYVVLMFDYRGFGASEGQPRQWLDPAREQQDWHSAIAYARSLPQVDAERIVLWGTSFSGGLVVDVAARDPGIAAIVCQCPMMDGQAAALNALQVSGVAQTMKLALLALRDTAGAALGRAPLYLPIIAAPGALGAMTTADAWQCHQTQLGTVADFVNLVTARTMLAVPLYRPLRAAHRVRCPALIQICSRDSVAPAASAQAAAERMADAQVKHYDVGHFDIYFGAAFERSVTDQLEFLRRVVPSSTQP